MPFGFLALLPLPTSVHFIFALRISFLIIKGYNCTILRSIEQNTIIGGQLIHNIVLVSVTHQHQSAIDIHVSSPFWTALPSPNLYHPSRLSETTGLSSLFHTANSHFLSILTYGNVYVSMLLFQFVPLSFPHCVHKSVIYVCISIATLQIGSSVVFLDSICMC